MWVGWGSGRWRLKAEGWRLEAGSWKLEAGGYGKNIKVVGLLF